MRSMEMSAKTVEAAVQAACEALGVDRDDINVSYEVLEFPTRKPVSYTHLDVYKRQRLIMALSSFASNTVSPGTSTLHSMVVVMPISIS